ncbi:hypothetical protein [Tatumella citrea]|uniref:Uncharacterized protein n=1 Tax=Tatumella citrea TaxID=53336 RepID=Q9X5W7_TATCI|nr:hypothetical protein [Tatumella citrea]AAD21205.1 unknown [Tatumella citrea]ARU96349.1 hypothetical protein A7K98_21000 [Tatumella citrea]ARV00383.1 hypothetical protein A7K99_20985 [Tatumella citrea]
MGQAQLCWGSAHPAYSIGALAKLKHKNLIQGLGFLYQKQNKKIKQRKIFERKNILEFFKGDTCYRTFAIFKT